MSGIGAAGDATFTRTMPRPSTATIDKPKRSRQEFNETRDIRTMQVKSPRELFLISANQKSESDTTRPCLFALTSTTDRERRANGDGLPGYDIRGETKTIEFDTDGNTCKSELIDEKLKQTTCSVQRGKYAIVMSRNRPWQAPTPPPLSSQAPT